MFFYVLVVAQLTQGYQPPKPFAQPLSVHATIAECELDLARRAATDYGLKLIPSPGLAGHGQFRAENPDDPWSARLKCVEIYQPNFGK